MVIQWYAWVFVDKSVQVKFSYSNFLFKFYLLQALLEVMKSIKLLAWKMSEGLGELQSYYHSYYLIFADFFDNTHSETNGKKENASIIVKESSSPSQRYIFEKYDNKIKLWKICFRYILTEYWLANIIILFLRYAYLTGNLFAYFEPPATYFVSMVTGFLFPSSSCFSFSEKHLHLQQIYPTNCQKDFLTMLKWMQRWFIHLNQFSTQWL